MIPDNHRLVMASQRLEALGDGIFGVAMTILVIELDLTDVKGHSVNDFLVAFQKSWTNFACYVISFIILGIMWFAHRMMFEYIGRTNRYFIFLGVLFYMTICLVPFSTKLLASHTLEWHAIFLYGLNLSMCNLSLYGQWTYGIHRPALLEREVPLTVKRQARLLFLLSPAVYLLAIVASPFFPKLSIFLYVITPVVYLFPNKLDKYLP